ncbi:protein of unknown function [Candidatus Methylocalor cossyra]|uniref:Uncharacterized protein n=1 Tax=Candidatus Methylocalor cossyra TaxID=3108543 RepID=A0ABM9NJ82_9GAMM
MGGLFDLADGLAYIGRRMKLLVRQFLKNRHHVFISTLAFGVLDEIRLPRRVVHAFKMFLYFCRTHACSSHCVLLTKVVAQSK